MKIEYLISKLQEIHSEFGNLDVVGADDYDLMGVEAQKYIKTNSVYNDIISRQTEDLDENYLEAMYVDGEYKNQFVSKGICVKIY